MFRFWIPGPLRYALHRRVFVNLWSGSAISGVVVKATRTYCVIKDAHVHEVGSNPVAADGEILIDRNQIDYTQIT
ncbi:Uncharacterised protein [Mycobacteroides abscessus subsp. abscessus]|uniref:hypothetical protein n=1 Tax=Mycobacteroides abscessus TaxID=36809 RepID=UPI00092AEFFF|nr:hypothetical protein [Mycobacteroides abscessus]SHR60481.1 Uncharacterised protein [Mycobacteroides abscessus subsp. abscessus]